MRHDTWRDSARVEVIEDRTQYYNDDILTTDDSCSFQLINTRKIRSYISCVIAFLS